MKDIFIVGPSSTGKTTLCEELVKHLNLPPGSHLSEIARDVMRRTGFSRDTVSRLDMQVAILKAHLEREHELRAKKAPILSDRSALDPVVYALMTATSQAERKERKDAMVELSGFSSAIEEYRSQKSLIVLLLPVKEWLVDDGVRALDNGDACAKEFTKLLENLEVPHMTIGPECPSLDARVERVLISAEEGRV